MSKFWLIGLISSLSLTACSTAEHIDPPVQKTISQACPAVPYYSASDQCEARREIKELQKKKVDTHVLQRMLVDGKVARDQARVCRGLKIPNPKGKCK